MKNINTFNENKLESAQKRIQQLQNDKQKQIQNLNEELKVNRNKIDEMENTNIELIGTMDMQMAFMKINNMEKCSKYEDFLFNVRQQ